jgi:heme exporter protein CcmD
MNLLPYIVLSYLTAALVLSGLAIVSWTQYRHLRRRLKLHEQMKKAAPRSPLPGAA